MTCKRPAALSVALLAKTTRLLDEAVPSLGAEQARELLIVAAGKNASTRQVYDFLAEHPDSLQRGQSDAPLALGRLARLLIDRGVSGIREPSCLDSERVIARPHRVEGGRVCRRCYRRRLADILDDDQGWQQLKRCLDNDGVSLAARVAGALVLIFGQSPTRLI